MIILHAGIVRGRLLLWGEQPAEETAAPARRRGRPATKVRRASPLPYTAGADALSAALAAAALDPVTNQASAEVALVWLPTVEGRPLASSPMIAEPPGPDERATVSPWEVAALSLPTERVIELLCYCAGRETLSQGIIAGADLAFCAQAVRFAGSIVARQAFLPGIDLSGASPYARWEPVIAGADAQRLARLAAAMPHACRALTGREAQFPPDTPSVVVLSAFITGVVDELVRSAFTPDSRSSVTALSRKQARSFESVHDQWLHALRADDGALKGDASELTRLAGQVREWQRPITAQAATPFRLCFRLEEPEAGEEMSGDVATTHAATSQGRWQVRYLLQAVDDPSLIVPAAQVWNARGRQATLLRRGAFRPREYMLSALGQAAKASPQVERSLKAATPDGYELDSAGAHEFLREQAWMLEQAGFGVMLPAWWTRKGTKLKLTARAVVESPKFQGGGRLTLEEIVKFDKEIDETEGIQRKGVVLATLSKLKQVCNHPAQFLGDNSSIPGRSGKLTRLTEMLEEVLATDERALVFTQFAEMGALIQRHLQETFGRDVLFLHGSAPKRQRDLMVSRFQSEDGGARVFLLSLKAGGTGLNLTAANHVFHFDRWWNPAVENQATDRAFRIGQRRNVQVHKFLCAGTLEEKIDEMIQHKQELAERIVGAGEGWLTELSTAALKEIFTLREGAVSE